MNLIAVILTKDEERNVVDCLKSLAWVDETIVFDAYSQDRTIELAVAAGARVVKHPFQDFAQQRNAALEMIEQEHSDELSQTWILFVDADERGTPELGQEVRRVIHNDEIAGWWVPRHNYVFGRLTRGAGYYPDYQMRLLRAGQGRYENPASEIVVLQGRDDYLSQSLIHYNYESVAQFHHKQRAREAFEATNLHRKGVKLRPYTFLRQPLRQFWWRYVTLKGYKDGWHGLRLCVLLAYYFGWRYYVRLWQMRRSGQRFD
jgi:glycosyltransferase involved in cell wall biosynthesis